MDTAEYISLLLGGISILYLLINKLISYIAKKSDKELEIIKASLDEFNKNMSNLSTKIEVSLEKLNNTIETTKDIKENLATFRQDLSSIQLDIRQLKERQDKLELITKTK